jgi:outer membrane lipoprotein LolB
MVRIYPLSLLALLLVGCATAPPAPSPLDWDRIKLERQSLNSWKLTGRAAVAAGAEGWNASMDWNQRERETELRLYGPFGAGALRVTTDGDSLNIETSKGETFTGADAKTMLEKTLGTSLPLTPLRYWLLGVPEPVAPALAQLNERGHLAQLDQEGWHVTYDQYRQVGGQWFPARVNLEQGDIKVKVVVDSWQLGG